MTVRKVKSSSADETEALGAQLALTLVPGDVVAVAGELGSGKTTFVRGAAFALGVEGPVRSPTFSIGHRYRAPTSSVCHLDLYRLESLDSEDPSLLDDHLGPDSICFVEWPEAAAGRLGSPRIEIKLRHTGPSSREIEIVERECAREAVREPVGEPVREPVGEPGVGAS